MTISLTIKVRQLYFLSISIFTDTILLFILAPPSAMAEYMEKDRRKMMIILMWFYRNTILTLI